MQIPSIHHDLFPTRIWVSDLSGLAGHFPAWQAAVEAMRAQSSAAAGRSNRHGWNSAKTVFAEPAFAILRQAVQAAFGHAFGQMGLNKDTRFRVEAWANVHENGAYNTAHLHQNVLLSGCFYLAAPEGSGAIIFRDPRPGASLSQFHGTGANNHQTVRVQPKTGSLLVFPNWLEHAVETHEGTTPRIAIAINALVG